MLVLVIIDLIGYKDKIDKTFKDKKDILNLDILHFRNTTQCVVLRKQNIEMKTEVQTYNYLEDYLDAIRTKGRYAFTVDELKDKFDVSDKAIHQNLYRLKSKKKIVQIHKGLYVLQLAEYSNYALILSSMHIDDMMNSLNKKFYLGILSAAEIHSASHQQSIFT